MADQQSKPKHDPSASQQLAAITAEVATCQKCPLARTRTNTVPGEGSPTAEIMFVGEGPGREEDESGRPFVGRAGRFLDELIESLPMRREDVYIANVVKCRPPNNRDPERTEVDQCSNYLRQQIDIIDPLVIVPLGRHALGWFMPELRITASNGKIFRHNNRVLMPLLHPSSGLRNPEHGRMLRESIHNLRDAILEGIRVKRETSQSVQPNAQPTTTASAPEPVTPELAPATQIVEEAKKVAATAIEPDAPADPPVNLFERPQTEEEIAAELKRQRAIEEAEEAAENETETFAVDDRQSSFF